MIKRLKLFKSETENDLKMALVDKSHQKIKFAYIRRIFRNIEKQQYLKNLLDCLKHNFKSENNVLKIKSLIVLHYFIRKSEFKNDKIINFAQRQLNEIRCGKKPLNQSFLMNLSASLSLNRTKSKIQIQNQQKQFIQKNIIQFYVLYLLKFMNSSESYLYAKQSTQPKDSKNNSPVKKQQKHLQKTTCQTKIQKTYKIKQRNINKSKQKQIMQKINHGFHIINLVNYVLQSQQGFNKMGRYYRQQQQILNLFLMYLDDLTIYNDYIKKTVKQITKAISKFKQEQVKHCFLFLTESQKTSDRLYFYQKVRKLTQLPTFLTIQSNDFERVAKQVKKVDKQLFMTVKNSKYSQQYRQKTLLCVTQGNISSQKPSKRSNMNRTQMYQKKSCNRTQQSYHKNLQRQQQNIIKYIEFFADVDQLDQDIQYDQFI